LKNIYIFKKLNSCCFLTFYDFLSLQLVK